MVNVSYKPLIDDMIWSYSRIRAFNDCPYQFFLRYIKQYKENNKFYTSYGSFIHRLLQRYYQGELTKNEILTEFLFGFTEQVKGVRPQETTVQKYIQAGCDYLRSFTPFPYHMIDVEKKVNFSTGQYQFVGFIDYLGEKDGKLYIVDHKSRELKPRSTYKKPTKADVELDHMLRQLYLYSAAIKQEYGVFPEALCFNCFRNKTFIKEQFDMQKYEETQQWAINSIEKISNTQTFEPHLNFFVCKYLCGVNDHCVYDIRVREEYRHK